MNGSGRNEHFMKAFDFCQRYCSDLFFLPGPPYPYILLTPDGWRYIRETRFLNQFSKELIRNAMAELVSTIVSFPSVHLGGVVVRRLPALF